MTVATYERPELAEVIPLLRRLSGDEKHETSGYDTLDVIWVLYDRILRVDPSRPDAVDRDRFLVSKGHGPHAYYAVLAAKGFFPLSWLDDLAGPNSPLGHHPDRTLVPGVEISSGSLGHGLGLGVGVALGLRAQQTHTPRVYVLLGDAELDEGSNHEAIFFAGTTGLDSLTAIVVDNASASHGWPGGIERRFTAEGWTGATVDGPDHAGLAAALRGHTGHAPHAVVVRTGAAIGGGR